MQTQKNQLIKKTSSEQVCSQVSSKSLRTNRQISEPVQVAIFIPTLRSSHSKRPWTPLCPVLQHNMITLNCRSQTRTTRNSQSANTEISKIGRGQTFQTLEDMFMRQAFMPQWVLRPFWVHERSKSGAQNQAHDMTEWILPQWVLPHWGIICHQLSHFPIHGNIEAMFLLVKKLFWPHATHHLRWGVFSVKDSK